MRKAYLASSFALGLSLTLAACGDDGTDLAVPDECNPLGASTHCLVPWPSSIYEVADDTATGFRLDYPDGALPVNIDNVALEPELYAKHDGFSSAAPAMVAFDVGVDGSNLVHFDNIADSLLPSSPTVLIDLDTGDLVPHFSELDVRGADTPADQALFIRSHQMLKRSGHYAVAIKKSLKAKDGKDLPISGGFKAILDGETTTHPLLEKIRPRYTTIFAALEAKGIAKTDLVVAWDFHTRSREQAQADLLDARTATLSMAGTDGAMLDFAVTATPVQSDTRIARRIDGTFKTPLFLTNNGSFAPSTTLQRDAMGKPMAAGYYNVPFTAIVPACALEVDHPPVGIIIYGHGLLGGADQAASSGARHAAAETCNILIGTEMRGMSSMDVPNVVLALNDANKGYGIFDVLVQGMMNHVALSQVAIGPMATRLFTQDGTDATPTIVDPTKVYWYGISQGGIMGTTVCAIDPLIKRCVVQVGAINYSLLLERSRDWPQYRTTLTGAYPNNFDTALLVSLMQQEWDRTEPTSVADVITNGGFGGEEKEVFMQIAIADDEVTNLASWYQARTMNVPVITPSPYVPYGVEPTSFPVSSGMVIYDFGEPPIPEGNEAPPDNDVHGNIRNKGATTTMMKRFYETGEIVQACVGEKGCDCTVAGACGTMF
jgi:hypothetical protein